MFWWYALRFVDILATAIFIAIAGTVLSAVLHWLPIIASRIHYDPSDGWSRMWVYCAAVIFTGLFCIFPISQLARGFRSCLREVVIHGPRMSVRTLASRWPKYCNTEGARFVLFLHSFRGEHELRSREKRITNTAWADEVEKIWFDMLKIHIGQFSIMAFFLGLPLFLTARLVKIVWLRLPNWRSADEHIAEALWPDFIAISVGGGNNAFGRFGATPIATSDESWRRLVRDLAENATIIVVAPGPTKGIIEEVFFVAREPRLLTKTLFVWPAGESPSVGPYAEASDLLFRNGLRIPHFDHRGLIFNLHGQSVPLTSAVRSRGSIRRAVLDLSNTSK